MFLQPPSLFNNTRPSQKMDYFGANPEADWCSLSGVYNSEEEADFMAQFLGNCSFQNQVDGFGSIQSIFPVSGDEIENYYFSDSHGSLEANNGSISMEFCVGDVGNSSSYLIEGEDCLSKEMSNCNVEEPAATEEKCDILPKSSRKRSTDVQKNKRNVRAKKGHMVVSTNNDDQSSGSCSEEDSNGSQVSSSLASKGSPILNSNGKIRASRGSATDPQSLYARKRRERINERLRILQNLVPNGTKVDISTMLEEAVQYVKFLQLQIKLLSSDDLWMYSPIAYNGMDIGLDIKIPTSRAS